MITLFTGGVKSGKSSWALALARLRWGGGTFLATAEAFDDEMRERIERHREERGDAFRTVEEPLAIEEHGSPRTLLDCVTMWINNSVYYGREEWRPRLETFLEGLQGEGIIVTNETGLGTIPADPEVRRYHRLLGEANMLAAARADQVVFMVSGMPWLIKGPPLETLSVGGGR